MAQVGYPDFTAPVSIIGYTIDVLPIEIKAQTLGMVKIDIAGQSLEQLKVEIIGQAVALNVNITSAEVAFNVKTESGANIVIDKLTVGAVTEDRRIVSNNAPTPVLVSPGTVYWRGKFFPRGCKGFINNIDVYCANADTVAHSFEIKVSPFPGYGPVYTATLTVPAGAPADWRSVSIQRFWNFDSMFIWLKPDHATYPTIGFDAAPPYDHHYSTDERTWTYLNSRLWIRVFMTGLTVGDLPISGIVNTVEIPSATSARQFVAKSVRPVSEAYDEVRAGGGELLVAMFFAYTASGRDYLRPRIRCDGVQVLPADLPFSAWKTYLTSETTPGVTIGKWDTVNHYYCIVVTLPISFKHSLEVGFYNASSTETITAYVCYTFKKVG